MLAEFVRSTNRSASSPISRMIKYPRFRMIAYKWYVAL